jgi:hypothetical protein
MVPAYSSDLGVATRALQELKELGYKLHREQAGSLHRILIPGPGIEASADALPLAICRAIVMLDDKKGPLRQAR